MNTYRIIALTFALLLLGTTDSNAQFSLGVQGGYNLDTFTDSGLADGSYYLGGQARFGLQGLPIILNPNANYYFSSLNDVNVFQMNADVLIPFGTHNAAFTPYAGAGLGITRVAYNADVPLFDDLLDTKQTNYGLNLMGGATFGSGPVHPFVQARVTLGDHVAFLNEDGSGGPGYMVTGGLLFHVGR